MAASMHRNSLQGLANTLADMARGGGSAVLYDSVADSGDGTLVIDLLTRCAQFGDVGLAPNLVVDRLADWLRQRAEPTRATTWSALVEAVIELRIASGPIPTVRESIVQLLVEVNVTLRTDGETRSAHLPTWPLWIRRSRAAGATSATIAS